MGKDLSLHRLERAKESLEDAKMALERERFNLAANRSYYCIFHCMRSILALENVDFKKHSSVISHFRKNYIRSEVFSERLSDIITALFRVRNKSDYEDFYVVAKKDVTKQVENAEYFLERIKDYLSGK